MVGFILSTIFKISISSLFKNMRSLRLTVFQLFTRKVISTKAILVFVFIYIMCSGNQVRYMEKDMISDIVLLDMQLHRPMRLRQEKIITFIM